MSKLVKAKVIEVTDETFEDEVLNSDVPTEVDFWAPWCGPCRMVSPIYDILAEEYDNFKFCKINVDENPETARRYQIVSIPMQIFFANGERVDDLLGAVPESMIRAKVQEVVRKYPTDELGRLKVLLSSWVENNSKHSKKFKNWNEKVEEFKTNAIYDELVDASKSMEEMSNKLYDIWNKL